MHQKFVSDESQRERYWGRSYWGWETFSKSRPNACHAALSHLEKLGKVRSIITQNVDRLHQMAGSKRVLELHGTTWVVTCLEPECDYKVGREKFQQTLLSMNPQIVEKEKLRHHANGDSKYSVGNDVDGDSAVRLNVRAMEHTPGLTRPDGDVEVELQETFHYPSCPRCGPEKGVLKPDVTFFGDNVPKQRVKLAYDR
jgi:NAD-dependent deacetylase sirtuin 4